MQPTRKHTTIKVNALSFARLVALMLEGNLNCRELAEETGLHYVTVLQYTREMYLAGACHIARREPDNRGRHITRVYKIGPGKDARPIRMTAAQRQARYRARTQALRTHAALSFMKEAA